ncbi:hypothetical protein EWM64_g5736 [Hericium alpestre]|uniref:O-methyltransferase C-terminal domain-containing protein n=1 Tax=Hericium alpestre TaxID=135208 RepID=A0A4Y9ZVJ6_9AGAM|nr:hypothetical protein EWM64_g5736 [Hericium alpestre]
MPAAANESVERKNVRALIGIISTVAEDAMNTWEQESGRIPSLDKPVDDTRAVAPELLRSMRLLESACFQLCSTLMPTSLSMITRSYAPIDSACLGVASQGKVADVLDGHPKGLHVDIIAEKTQLPAEKLARVLRLLAVKHCFKEVSKDVSANNRLSHSIRSTTPLAALISTFSDICHENAWPFLYSTLADPEYGPSNSPTKTSFSWSMRKEKPDATFFGYLAERPEKSEMFGKAMTAFDAGGVQEFYPIGSLPAGATWCDVGGGQGGVLIPVANTHPTLRLTLQDQLHVIEEAKQHFAQECPGVLNEKRISFVPIDFFKEPPVPNQDVYYMRMIIHDWPDAESIQILKNVRKAMGPQSRLLIHDYVLPSLDSKAQTQHIPKPLLPTYYGAGGQRSFMMDQHAGAAELEGAHAAGLHQPRPRQRARHPHSPRRIEWHTVPEIPALEELPKA